MTVKEFVDQVVLISEGKLPTFVVGSAKWNRIIAQGNFFLKEFAREKGIQWNMFYEPDYPLGTVTVGTRTLELPDEVYDVSRQLGDSLRIAHSDGENHTEYDFVEARDLKRLNGNICTRRGRFIEFKKAFEASDPEIGGQVLAPVHILPDPFTREKEEIPADLDSWLIYAVAADKVKNDVTRKDLRADLVAQANEAMMSLQEKNEGQISVASADWNPLGWSL